MVSSICFWSTVAFDIKCDIQTIAWVDVVNGTVQVTTCVTKNVKITTPGQTVASINYLSADEFKEKYSEVKWLKIDSQTVNYLPKDLEKFFPNLEGIHIQHSHLKSIEKSDLKVFPKLKVIRLYGNDLQTLEEDLFNVNQNLVFIDLSDNKISSIEKNTFKTLSELKYLRFEDNKCLSTTVHAQTNTTALKIEIEKFDELLKNNCLPITCDYSDSLVLKDIAIEKPVGYGCNVKDLNIDTVNKKIVRFVGTHTAENKNENVKLFLAIGQSIQFMPFELAEHFPSLDKIVIENSELSSITKVDLKEFPSLKVISLRGNVLSTIADGTFDSVVFLEYLYLTNNNIASLPSEAFAKLSKLKVLDLAYNQLTSLKIELFPSPCSINDFRANNNKLEIIDIEVLTLLKNATPQLRNNTCIDNYNINNKVNLKEVVKTKCKRS